MGRAKKGPEKYDMDFKFPRNDREFLFNEDGTDRYTVEQLFEYAGKNPSEYAKGFLSDVLPLYRENPLSLTPNRLYTLQNLAANYCPAFEDFNKKFFEWYNSREDIQEVYKHAAPQQYWWQDESGQYINAEESKGKGWHDAPVNFISFRRVMHGHSATTYRELNREIRYDVGDMVQLRKPFVGNYRRDPCYGQPSTDDRIGTVVEHKDATDRRSRGGKGSRLINVLWLNNGQTIEVPERVLKKLPKQK